jgi:hypothetical protein
MTDHITTKQGDTMTISELAKTVIDNEMKRAQLEIDLYKTELESKLAWFEVHKLSYDERLKKLICELNDREPRD